MEIRVRARVQCADGIGGEATRVIVHPSSKRVTRVIVKEKRAPHIERVVPFRFVQEATADNIRLTCSLQELSRMQAFRQTRRVETDSGLYGGSSYAQTTYGGPRYKSVKQENIPEDELAVGADARIRATDGRAGRIGEFMVDPSNGSITHLLLKEGPLWAPKGVRVPVSEVDRIEERAVYLRLDRAGLDALPVTAVRRG